MTKVNSESDGGGDRPIVAELEIGRRERKKEDTRMRIFRAAVELFHEKGFEATTVDEITERADVGKGTFFNYFPRKESVLAYLSEMQLAEAEEKASDILAAASSAREKTLELLTGVAATYEEFPEVSRLAVVELMKRVASTREVHQRWRDLMVRILEQGRQTGEIRPDVDLERAAILLNLVFIGTVFMWATLPGFASALRDEMRERLTLVMDGLTA